MADPITLMVASAVVGAVGSIAQGVSANKAAKFNAQVAANNARLAQQTGEENAARIQRQSTQIEGAQKATLGASGISLTGSSLDVLSDTAIEGELAALDAKNAGINDASRFRAEEKLARARGRAALIGGFMGAGTKLLGASSSFKKAFGGNGRLSGSAASAPAGFKRAGLL